MHNISNQPSNVNSTPNHDPMKSHVDEIMEKVLNTTDGKVAAQISCLLLLMNISFTRVFATLNKASGECGIAAAKYGFNSADKFATTGNLIAVGGLALGAAGVAQGISACNSTKELAQVQELRSINIADINARTIKGPDITIQVEAVDEPISPILEEEVFFDAEETLSSTQSKQEEQIEEPQTIENTNDQDKITKEEANQHIKKENKEYDVKKDLIEAKQGKFEAAMQVAQGTQTVFQGASNFEKAKSDTDTVVQQVQQANQNNLKDTADDVKRRGDKLTEFNPFEQNGASLRG